MKATEQYFPVVLVCMLYKVVLILSLWMKSTVTTQVIANELLLLSVLFIRETHNCNSTLKIQYFSGLLC